MRLTASEVLRRAARRLLKTGWMQGSFGGNAGPNCAVGAINKAGGGPGTAVGHEAMKRLWTVLGIEPGTLVRWNDTKGRTRAQVVTALRKAARLGRGAPRRADRRGR